MGIDPADCLVFEDTPAGVQSGRAAGMRVIGISTWKTREELHEADAVVANFTWLTWRRVGEGIEVEISAPKGS